MTDTLEALIAAGTPGPWEASPWAACGDFIISAPNAHDIATVNANNGFDEPTAYPSAANAALIVAAVNALPGLIAEVHDLRELLTRAREYIDGQIDVIDGDYGEPHPNRAMILASAIDEALEPRS